MRVYNKIGTKDRLFEMFEKVNKIKLNEGDGMWSNSKEVVDWNESNDGSIQIKFSDNSSDIFNYYDDLDDQGVTYNSSLDSSNDSILLYKNVDGTLTAKVKANSSTQNPDNPEYEIMDVLSVEPSNTNESFDSPMEKDEKYLDKTVGDESSQVSKYDDGTRYPVEDKLKVKDPSLEKLKGDDAPIEECDDCGNEDDIAMDMGFEDQMEGGKADDAMPSNFDPEQIVMGIKIEMEHTDDPQKALEIAMDHLTEIPDYYTRLSAMEAEAKGDSKEYNDGIGNGEESEEENPEDALLDPSKHWVDDYSPQNVTDEGLEQHQVDPEAGEEEYEEMEKLKNGDLN